MASTAVAVAVQTAMEPIQVTPASPSSRSATVSPVDSETSSNTSKSSSPTPKPVLPLLKTPTSAGAMLPSELPRSPLAGSVFLDVIKKEDDIKTPITPPSAYMDFLKALSPAISTPMTAGSMNTSFSWTDRSGKLTPITQPSSAASFYGSTNENNKRTASSTAATSAPLVPPSPFVRPTYSRTASGRTPTTLRRLRIPQSPSSYSPVSESPKSAMLRSPFSPTSWYMAGKNNYFEAPRSAVSKTVSVKQVVTRTVTYTRTPLEPAPKGKRRKVE